jgi:hypothetical protein
MHRASSTAVLVGAATVAANELRQLQCPSSAVGGDVKKEQPDVHGLHLSRAGARTEFAVKGAMNLVGHLKGSN